MNKKVYGVLGISSIMANWNADFSGYPKTISDGTVYGSDKALKYPIKKMWDNQGEKVLYIKSMIFDEKTGDLIPRTLKQRFEQLFQIEDLKKVKDHKDVVKKLFQAIDVKNFGATFAESEYNIAITGAVQVGQGFNKYKDSNADEQQILSPFKDPGKEEAKNSTLGTKIVSDEAHYFYPFVINPLAYKAMVELDVTDGYTQEDYETFKKTALVATTAYATNAKVGCENEFGLFIETKIDTYLPNLDKYIEFEKKEDKNVIKILDSLAKLMSDLVDDIEAIEIYYNPDTTILDEHIETAKKYSILTLKEV
jgi:CRISPR-associated protein Csh2